MLLYHGVSDQGVYSVGAALLDLEDPTIILARTALPLFEPHESYEINGVIHNVVFPCGVVKRGDTLYIYYGGADRVLGVASMNLDVVVDALVRSTKF